MTRPADLVLPPSALPRDPRRPESAALPERYGALLASGWKVHRKGITAAETRAAVAPWLPQVRDQAIEWLVIRPAGVTVFSVEVGRAVAAGNAQNSPLVMYQKTPERIATGIVEESWLHQQRVQGDGAYIRIAGLVGTPTTWSSTAGQSELTYAQGTVPVGFAIFYRRANSR